MRTLVCKILAAAAEDCKLLLQTARPTTDHTSTPLQADTYTDTTQPPAQSLPVPLSPRFPAGGPHTPTNAHTSGARDTGLPHPPKQQHTPATDPSAGHPSPPPTHDNPHTPTAGSPAPHSTPTLPSGPHTPPAHTPENPGPPFPAPKCSPCELFPPADANPHNPSHCRTPAQPSPEGEDRSAAPPSPAAADQIGPPGCQVMAGPARAPIPNLQPEDMPSITPAVAAPEAAAQRPASARITAQPASPKTTTPTSSSSSSTSSASSSDPPLPADLIHKATAKAKAAAARKATRGPRPPHRQPRHPGSTLGSPPTRRRHPHTSGPRSSSTSNRTPYQNPIPNPNRRPTDHTTTNSTTTNTTPRSSQHHKRKEGNPSDTALTQTLNQTRTPRLPQPEPPSPNRPPPPQRRPPNTAPVKTLVNIPISKRPVIHPQQTTTAGGQTNPGTWDPPTSVTVKPGCRPAPATHQTVRPQGLRTMPDAPPPPGGPEYPQGLLGPYPQHHPHHHQRHHDQRPHHHQHHHHQHHPHHYHCPPPYPTGPPPPMHEQHQLMGWQQPGAPPPYLAYYQGPSPRTRNCIPPATTSMPGGPRAKPHRGQSHDPYHQLPPPPHPYAADPWRAGDAPPPKTRRDLLTGLTGSVPRTAAHPLPPRHGGPTRGAHAFHTATTPQALTCAAPAPQGATKDPQGPAPAAPAPPGAAIRTTAAPCPPPLPPLSP